MSRLPPPSAPGLSELTDSQHNARNYGSSIAVPASSLKGLKRTVPPPAVQSEAKRSTLADRAGEYPARASASTSSHTTYGSIRAQSITNISQLKQPSALQPPRHTSTASSSFAKSFGPGRHAPTERPPTRTGRPVHARSKSQAPRPRTAHGHRLEEPVDAPDDNGTTRSSSSYDTSHSHPLHVKKLKSQRCAPLLPTIRTSSLINQFKNMSLNEQGLQKKSLPVNAQFSQSTSQLPRFPIMSLHMIEERDQTTGSSDTGSATQLEVPGGT